MLIAYMFIAAVNQLLWITFAPITGDATKYYGVSDLKIGMTPFRSGQMRL